MTLSGSERLLTWTDVAALPWVCRIERDAREVRDLVRAIMSAAQRYRRGELAAHVRDRLTALGGRPLERGQPLRLDVAQSSLRSAANCGRSAPS